MRSIAFMCNCQNKSTEGPDRSRQRLMARMVSPFVLQELQVQADEVQVALWSGVVAPPQLSIEPGTHDLNTLMDVHTHVGHGILHIVTPQICGGQELL